MAGQGQPRVNLSGIGWKDKSTKNAQNEIAITELSVFRRLDDNLAGMDGTLSVPSASWSWAAWGEWKSILPLICSTLYRPCPLDLAKPLVTRLGCGLIGWDQRIYIPANQGDATEHRILVDARTGHPSIAMSTAPTHFPRLFLFWNYLRVRQRWEVPLRAHEGAISRTIQNVRERNHLVSASG